MRNGRFWNRLLLVLMMLATAITASAGRPAQAHDATITAPLDPETTGNTLSLTGSGYISIPNAPALNPTGGLTLEVWVRRPDTSTSCQTIVGKDFESGYWLGICSNKLRFYGNGVDSLIDGTRAFVAGEWTHVAATFDGTTRRLYMNGVLDTEVTLAGPLAVNSQPLQIGADLAIYRINAHLADVRLWGVARSQAEIRRDMVRLFDTAQPNLIAAWHLEGNTNDVFGHYDGTGYGAFYFNGPAAPPFSYEPVLIPRLGSVPAIDGSCETTAYGNAVRVPIWLDTSYPPSPVWVNVGATSSNVYVCMDRADITTSFATLYLDPDNSAHALAQTTDSAFIAYSPGYTSTVRACRHGDGVGGYGPAPVCSYDAKMYLGEFDTAAEFMFARSYMTSTSSVFRMGFMQHWLGGVSGNDRGWPTGIGWNAPATWVAFRINDAALPRYDGANPSVVVRHTPQPVVRRGNTVYITADARDDVDIASVDIIVDGITRNSCTAAGTNNTTWSCSYSQVLPLGRHNYYARVTDHRGRLGFAPLTPVFVQVDGQAPRITVNHTPRQPNLRVPRADHGCHLHVWL